MNRSSSITTTANIENKPVDILDEAGFCYIKAFLSIDKSFKIC